MASWLDIVGSFIIGSIILLILMNLNMFITTTASENMFENITQESLNATSLVLEDDIYKMGYQVSGSYLEVADSEEVKFYGDINNDNDVDTVYYYLGDTKTVPSQNPDDRMLYRIINNQNPKPFSPVIDVNFTYYDSMGAQIPYNYLQNSVHRDRVRTISVYVYLESSEPVDGNYQSAEWKRQIIPKNLR